jgi:amino acid transporter
VLRNEYFHNGLHVCNDAFYERKPPKLAIQLLIFSVDQRRRWYEIDFALDSQAADTFLDNSFFVFSGMALAAGGPASLLISEVLAVIVTYCATESLSEMNCYQPSGSFITFTHLYLDPAWSFAVGWIYAIRSMISIPFALAATATLLNAYLPSLGTTAWVGILLIPVLAIIFAQSKAMAQLAAVTGLIKTLGLLGFA